MSRTRVLAIVAFGLAAVASAMAAARGPAVSERAVYSWPPTTLPSVTPTRTWLTPLLVARRQVDELDAQLPCGARPTLEGAKDPTLILATARDTARWNGLEVRRSTRGHATVMRVGDRQVARLTTPGGDCSLRLRITGLAWTVDRSGERLASGRLESPIGVSGLFTQLDLRERPGLRVKVSPYPQDTRPSSWQLAFQALCVLLVGAGILAAVPLGQRGSLGLTRPGLSGQDVVVALCLAAYWMLAPLQDDDGWVRARQTNSLVSGGFSSYYQHLGVNLPSITWFEWLQQFAVAHTGSLVLNRLPSVAILAATWLVCRACLSRLLGRGPGRRDGAWWGAAVTFALGTAAFGLTLRPEPPIALLAAGVLACCVRYASSPRLAPLLGAVLLSGSAVAIHPTGVVALSPLLVCLPRVYSDMRTGITSSPLEFVGITLIGLAWTLLLLFVDSDFGHRRESAELVSADSSESQSPLQEFDRYRRLLAIGGTPLRREFVALLCLSVAAMVVGRFWKRSLAEKLPSASIAIALIFLMLTPSKWIWHFGTLIGFCAVAVGIEAHRLAVSRRSTVARWGAALIVLVSGLWAARGSFQWTTYETGSPAAWNDVPYVPILLGTGAAVLLPIALNPRRRPLLRPELAALLAVVVALIGTTAVALAVDATRTPGWTAARQAWSDLVGSGSCGMASGLTVAAPDSMHPLQRVGARPSRRLGDRVHESGPDGSALDGTSTSSWFLLPHESIGVLVNGGGDQELVVTWGLMKGHHIRPVASGVVGAGFASQGLAPARRVLIDESSLPKRPVSANVVRLEPRAQADLRTGPSAQLVSFRRTALDSRMRGHGFRTLVTPYLLEGIPCVALPPLRYGVAGSPDLIVEGDLWPAAVGGSSPFAGVADVYDLLRVPVESWDSNRGSIYVYWVVSDPRDAVAPAARRVTAS